MPESVRCDEKLPHRFHEHHKQVEVVCSGLTRCGAVDHEGHTFMQEQRLWCPGICDCHSPFRGLHGPGDHK